MDSAAAPVPAESAEESETPVPGPVPRYELKSWRRRFGLVAGITGRGSEEGRGFDLGLWSDAPVGEVMGRWRAFRRALPGFGAVVLGHQVHGIEVETVSGGRGWTHLEGVDGWVTATAGVLLTVTVADCVPVYLTIAGRAIALLHAGWRGTAGGILTGGLERLCRLASAARTDVTMHCGVGICGECYEVGSEVMAGCGMAAEGAGPWHLDLRARLVDQARRAGVHRITVSDWCSAHHRADFFSHRVSRGSDGRMVAYLGIPSVDSPREVR